MSLPARTHHQHVYTCSDIGVSNEADNRGVANEAGHTGVSNEAGNRGVANEAGHTGVSNEAGNRGVANEAGHTGVSNETGNTGVANKKLAYNLPLFWRDTREHPPIIVPLSPRLCVCV